MSANTVEPPVVAEAPASAGLESPAPARSIGTLLYRRVWRWHFYAGLFSVPVLLVAAATGALYVFVEELQPVFYPGLFVVEQRGEPESYDAQLASVRTFAPEATLHGLYPASRPDRSTVVWVSREKAGSEGKEYSSIFVDPYTAETLGEQRSSFFIVVLDIHRTLLAGTAGRIAVELATSWGIVLMLTGVYLWWPRGRERFWGVWLPRLRRKSYVVWRDLHTVTSLYLAVFTLLILASGLAFSFVVGQGWFLFNAQTGGFPEAMVSPPKAESVPEAGQTARISIDEAVRIAEASLGRGEHLEVQLPHDADDSYVVAWVDHDDPSTIKGMAVDPYSGQPLTTVRWADDFSLSAKAQIYSYPIHVGSIFGMPTKVLAFVVCLALIFATVSGAVMWWVRRPRGKTGFPARVHCRLPKWLIAVVVVLSVLTPTVGLSVLLILLGEKLAGFWPRGGATGRL